MSVLRHAGAVISGQRQGSDVDDRDLVETFGQDRRRQRDRRGCRPAPRPVRRRGSVHHWFAAVCALLVVGRRSLLSPT